MIAWWWLLIAFWLGTGIGVLIMGLLVSQRIMDDDTLRALEEYKR